MGVRIANSRLAVSAKPPKMNEWLSTASAVSRPVSAGALGVGDHLPAYRATPGLCFGARPDAALLRPRQPCESGGSREHELRHRPDPVPVVRAYPLFASAWVIPISRGGERVPFRIRGDAKPPESELGELPGAEQGRRIGGGASGYAAVSGHQPRGENGAQVAYSLGRRARISGDGTWPAGTSTEAPRASSRSVARA